MEKANRLKTREKVSYGLGDLGNNIAYGAVGFYFVFFLTDGAGLSPIWAGNIFMIIRIWNSAWDLIIGTLSDRTKTKLGRRRPYLLTGGIPLGISFALLWVVPFKGEMALVIYYTVVGILFNTLYSYVSIPYNSMLPDLSQDYDERTSISGFKMAFSFIGSLVSAMGVTLIVDTIYAGKSQYTKSFPIMGIILGAGIVICILCAFFGTKERVEAAIPKKQGNIVKNIRSLLRLKEYRYVLGVFLFNMVSFDIIMALYIYYMKYALKISDDLSYIFMAIPLVAAVVVTPFWVSVSNKLGKEKTYAISAVYFLLPLLSCLIIPADNKPVTVAVTILIGIGISASQVLVYSILPDVVEVDEAENGVRREGMIYGVTMFLYKIGSAILVALVTAAMGWFGYVESSGDAVIAQTDNAVRGIRILMALAPALMLVISIVFVRRLSNGKDRLEKMKHSIAKSVG